MSPQDCLLREGMAMMAITGIQLMLKPAPPRVKELMNNIQKKWLQKKHQVKLEPMKMLPIKKHPSPS